MMKDKFPGYYYRPKDNDLRRLWRTCVFVLDANVLLNLYRYSDPVREEWITLLTSVRSRLWLPHQGALEYHRNRLDRVTQTMDELDEANTQLCRWCNGLKNHVRDLSERHFVETPGSLEPVDELVQSVCKHLESRKKQVQGFLDDDKVMDRITSIFEGRVGEPYDADTMEHLYEVGARRFEHRIPPGFEDQEKTGTDMYGDWVLWSQVMHYAKEVGKPIIFVTADMKGDWWSTARGRSRPRPRPELIQEMRENAGQDFHMYQPDEFLESAKPYLRAAVSDEAVKEAQEVKRRPAVETTGGLLYEPLARFQAEMDARLKEWAGLPALQARLAVDRTTEAQAAELRKIAAAAMPEIRLAEAATAGYRKMVAAVMPDIRLVEAAAAEYRKMLAVAIPAIQMAEMARQVLDPYLWPMNRPARTPHQPEPPSQDAGEESDQAGQGDTGPGA